MRILITGMGGELGTRVAQLLEAERWVDALAGMDIDPPRRRLKRADFHRIDPRNRRLTFSNGVIADYDALVSSVPLPDVIAMIEGAPPDVVAASRRLARSGCSPWAVGSAPRPATRRPMQPSSGTGPGRCSAAALRSSR